MSGNQPVALCCLPRRVDKGPCIDNPRFGLQTQYLFFARDRLVEDNAIKLKTVYPDIEVREKWFASIRNDTQFGKAADIGCLRGKRINRNPAIEIVERVPVQARNGNARKCTLIILNADIDEFGFSVD